MSCNFKRDILPPDLNRTGARASFTSALEGFLIVSLVVEPVEDLLSDLLLKEATLAAVRGALTGMRRHVWKLEPHPIL